MMVDNCNFFTKISLILPCDPRETNHSSEKTSRSAPSACDLSTKLFFFPTESEIIEPLRKTEPLSGAVTQSDAEGAL